MEGKSQRHIKGEAFTHV